MTRMINKRWTALTLALAFTALTAGPAYAVDPPKWVAVLYVEAQKMVGLRWMPTPGATGYKVLRSATAGSGYEEIASTAAPQHFDKAVEPGDTFYYVLQAVVGAETSANSDEKSVKIPGQKKVTINPPKMNKPTVQSVTEFGKVNFKVGLSWDRNPSPDVVAYNIYRSETAGSGHQLVGSVSEAQYIDTAVEQGKVYYYVVSALNNSFQETPFSAEQPADLKAAQKAAKKKKRVTANKLAMVGSSEVAILSGDLEVHLAGPMDSAVNSEGDIYVLNSSTGAISRFDEDGSYKGRFGEAGAGDDKLALPLGLGIDDDDIIWVADSAKILSYSEDGRFIKSFVVPFPEEQEVIDAANSALRNNKKAKVVTFDVAPTKDGNLAISDNGFHRVVIMDTDGDYVTSFGSYGTEANQFKNPGSIAVNTKGEIAVNDGQNRRVSVYTPEYEYKMSMGSSKNMVGAFLGLYGIDSDEKGDWIVSDPPMATVQFFSGEDGKYLYHLADEKMQADEGSKGQRPTLRLSNPAGVSYNRDSRRVVIPMTVMNQLMIRQMLD